MSKTNYQIAHEFAYGARHGKSLHMFIDGDNIYSYGYHFCIAKRVGETILFTTRKYSTTTAKHIGYVLNATSHMSKVYCAYPNGTHNDNLKAFLDAIKSVLPNLANARKPEKYLHLIQHHFNQAKKYCEFFNIEMSDELAEYANCQVDEKYLTELRNKELEARKAKIAKIKEALRKWRIRETNFAPLLDFQELRVNEEKNRIETTMGVQIPLELGKKFYERLRSGELRVGESLLYYSVRHISDKELWIGCHKFKRKYLMEFGEQAFA